jgi:hypothetical protein
MISHGGALGDNGFTIPALTALRKRYDEMYLYCTRSGVTALKDTGLIDRFITDRPGMADASKADRREWLLHATRDIDFQARLNFNGVVPGRYMFHASDPKFHNSVEWKRANAEGVNFFDAFSERAYRQGCLSNRAFSEAIGKRPTIHLTHRELSWLQGFRHTHNIPEDAFLLGWQFTGSSKIKWYPFFDLVVQKGIMRKYPQVYVVGLGDLENKMIWDRKGHQGRYVNLGKSISFRQACILTSILDCLVAPETGVMVFAQAWEHVPKILLATHTYGYHIVRQGDTGTRGQGEKGKKRFAPSLSPAVPSETVIIQSEAKCSPCYNIVFDCEHDGDNPWTLCMGKIPPEKVITAICSILDKSRIQDRVSGIEKEVTDIGENSGFAIEHKVTEC